MRILFLSDDFPPHSFGGGGIIAYRLAKELSKAGNKIYVITTVRKKSLEGINTFENLKIYQIYSEYPLYLRSWLSLYNPQTISKIRKIIQDIKPDIVHAHNIHHYLSYYSLKIAKRYSGAVFLTAHDVMMIHYGKLMPKNADCFYKVNFQDQIKEVGKGYNPFRNAIIRYYLKFADRIFAVSNALKKVLEINGIKNIEPIYNGISVNEWSPDLEKGKEFKTKYNLYNKKIIFLAGRLTGKAKGGREILEALSLVKKEIDNSVLVIASKMNDYIREIKITAEQSRLGENIVFTGWLEEDGLKAAYSIADICVVPSICFDSFPTTNLEAMASKKPVIGTCFGGTSEIVIDNKTGYIINPFNIEKLAEKIIDLLKNPQKAKQFGEAGYERVKEKFSLENQVKETLEWYNKFI